MNETMRRLTVLIGTGLLAACGQSASSPSNDTDNGFNVMAANIAAGTNAIENAINAAENAAQNVAEPDNVVVGALPLRLGFFVSNGTDCAKASSATISLIRRDGYSGARYSCTFGKIEKTGPNTYRVAESCTEVSSFGRGAEPKDSVRIYEVPDDASFSSKSDAGWESQARFCAQSSLPEPWRTDASASVPG